MEKLKGTPITTKALLYSSLIGALVLAISHSHSALAAETRASPQSTQSNSTSNTYNARLQKQSQNEGTCGNSDDLARRVEVCAKPLMDLLQGTVDRWPRTDDDARLLCESFSISERCIRESSRKCGKGIQKTIISTIALSIGRARKRECSKSKWPAIVKTTTCLEKKQFVIHEWMGNVTGRLSAIEMQTRDSHLKVNGFCCMLSDIEQEIKQILSPYCPAESQLIVRLYRAVLEDVIELLCHNSKCKDYLKGYRIGKADNFDGLISILLRIVFSLENS